MSASSQHGPSRRGVLAGGGLVVAFSLPPLRRLLAEEAQNVGKEPNTAPRLPGSLKDSPMLDSWIRIDADGTITVFTGKVELGQGIKTALIQVAAEELSVDPHAITLITADTQTTPNEAYTAGSHSMQDSGTALLNAAAQARAILTDLAAQRLGLPAEQLTARGGAIAAPDGRSVRYGELVTGQELHRAAAPTSPLKDPGAYTVIGKAVPRVDIPAKVTGGPAYVQDLRLPGMVHARVVRPPTRGGRLRAVDTAAVERLPGVLTVVRDGSYLAVIAEKEFQAVTAMRALADAAQWEPGPTLPDRATLYATIEGWPAEHRTILDRGPAASGTAKTVEATFRRPYQMHASIGPSCAVGLMDGGRLTVWTHTQGVYPLRKAIAEMLRMPAENVHCVHLEGSGCYGHNAADDAGADAALLARALPGRPVRVQWMREDEHGWEPYGPAMVSKVRASLDASGRIADWRYEVWSNPHNTRPGAAGNLMSARYLEQPFQPPPPKPLPQPEGGGDRNAIPLYTLPAAHVVHHFIPEAPLRTSAARALGAYLNIFAIESFMDELAAAAGADPVEFRLSHLDDQRARDVVTMAAERFGWGQAAALPKGRGRGFGFARYKNLAAYAAVAAEVEVERETGRARLVRAVAAVDSGHAVNPDGIRNQIEGGILQSMSWTLYEAVDFGSEGVRSHDWSTYPILRFPAVPDSIEVHIIDRPGQPYLGTGEATQGPTSAAVANAVAQAAGVRIHDLPLSADRVKAAIGV
ncbi:molybdopterin cofactor-binding domain-containing protein [Azospirillum sp.]|uniref:xanthine dehydrogenase family protein molybdopterin-binding subunit n=1 Tax=Azospirillum sp. TaxID=34012 RepID=UPI003D75FA07